MVRQALLLANSQFNDSRFRSLNGPNLDVNRFGMLLLDQQIGMFQQVTVLCDEDYYTIGNHIVDLFDDKQANDLLLLYISGHGYLNEYDNHLFFPVRNSVFDNISATSLSAIDINNILNESRSCNQILIIDCCFSGMFYGHDRSPFINIIAKEFVGGSGRVILASSTDLAYESAELGGFGIFTHFLIEGIETGAAARFKIWIDESDMFSYAVKMTKRENPNMDPRRWYFFTQDPLAIARNKHWIPENYKANFEARKARGEGGGPEEQFFVDLVEEGYDVPRARRLAKKQAEELRLTQIGGIIALFIVLTVVFAISYLIRLVF